jgi:general secretion pathway protein K
MLQKRSERGVALLAALLAISLMTVLVIDFTNATALGYRSAANRVNALRADCLAKSAIAVGLSLLSQQAILNSASQKPFYALNQPWAMPYPPVPVGGGTASLSIVDDARKININLLINPRTGAINRDVAQILTRLFEIIGVPQTILPAIVDWLDPDSVESPDGGAEADYYLRLIPPYEPRNGPMPTIGDLRMIRGMTTPIFFRLINFVTTSPESRVNINTAPPEVIAALSPQLASSPREIKEILAIRMATPFQDVTDFASLPGVGQNSADLMRLLTTQSEYFTINGVGTYAGTRKFIFATFRSNPNGTAVLTSWREN